ncbi:acyl-CoA synthetase [Ferrovibrio sp.]|uniref:acyl-CoA synthetase n=1 Tax=Ferrovibrio sp. TaxID=1917215 RepID=UPI001B6CFBB3|nr:acyl-CoA synthetase [Ferrovibrio sp.]MBP7065789.1 acyl-CoA synthetase [Ferrovibrio sp.]
MLHPAFHAQSQPDKPAYIMAGSGASLSYAELDRRSNQGAQLFRFLGLQPQDHIALLVENSLGFMEICWAAQRSGLFFTAISTHLTPDEIAYIIRDCGARVFITSAALADTATMLRPLLPEALPCYMAGGAQAGYADWQAALDRQPAIPVADEVSGRDMLYSSGTTGRPKGVKPAFGGEKLGWVSPTLLLLCQKMCGMTADSIYLSPAPLYHAAPLRFCMTAVALGGSVIVMEKFDAESFLGLVQQYRVTQTQLVPTMFVRMLKLPDAIRQRFDISSLRAAVHAAAPCPVEVKQQMIDWWGPILIEYYAGTEGNGVTIIDSAAWLEHRGSVGRSLVGEIKILDDAGAELPPGQVGSIYFAGGPAFSYHNDAAKTAGAHHAAGWSTLGDVGHLDAEGYLYLSDRKAYMIISGGVNIYPQETENVLIQHPAVLDCAVFGVPDEEMGEQVKAVVQVQQPAIASPALAAELIGFCRQHLSAIKCPRSIDFEAELPRTPTGKLLKRLLRDRYWPAAVR